MLQTQEPKSHTTGHCTQISNRKGRPFAHGKSSPIKAKTLGGIVHGIVQSSQRAAKRSVAMRTGAVRS